MKTAETKHTTTAAKTNTSQPALPFFRQGEGSFFSTSAREPSFFGGVRPGNLPVQAKLSVGQPGDKFEKEADTMADKVVQKLSEPAAATPASASGATPSSAGATPPAPTPSTSAAPAANATSSSNGSAIQTKSFASTITPLVQKCAACDKDEKLHKKEEEKDGREEKIHRKCDKCAKEEKLQRKEIDAAPTTSGPSLGDRLDNSRNGGAPLPPEVQERMGGAFGADFSPVRIHTGPEAVQMNKDLNAKAFTHQNHIYFNSNNYDVQSQGGQHLLAHELTHTLQQGAVKSSMTDSGMTDGKTTVDNTAGADLVSRAPDDTIMRAALFSSTIEICYNVLKSRTFKVSAGVLRVTIHPRLSNPGDPDCKHHKYRVYLVEDGFWSDTENPSGEQDTSKPVTLEWKNVSPAQYYLRFERNDNSPLCCLEGTVDVSELTETERKKEEFCDEKRAKKEFPSQNGGVWNWAGTGHGGTYGPGPKLGGPLTVYQRDPGIASGATCRGACGPDCDTCEGHPEIYVLDSISGEVWRYTNFQDCGAHEGCRQHDAAFDWAAAEKGEVGRGAVLQKWHMAANYECFCNYDLGLCKGWIGGAPPHDMRLYFADKVEKVRAAAAGKGQTGPSKEVPLIDQDTYTKAQDLIHNKEFALALDAVMTDLMASKKVNPALFTIKYEDRGDSGEGLTTTQYHQDPKSKNYLPDGPSKLLLYTPAFTSVHWLVSSLMHEYQHVLQQQRPTTADELTPIAKGGHAEEFMEAGEVEAYLWELENSKDTGVKAHPGSIRELFVRLTEHYKNLGVYNPARQAKYRLRYEAARKLVTPKTKEEEELEKCDQGKLPPAQCDKLYDEVKKRFGDKERKKDIDPDKDADKSRIRVDDAPVADRFRLIYNRLDSWDIYIRRVHETWYEEFTTEFSLNVKRLKWLSDLKAKTGDYKADFRNIGNFDVDKTRKKFEKDTLEKIEGEINTLNHSIANWYKGKSGDTDDLDTIIEKIHKKGTELWREEWGALILAVNRILSSLWPPARTRIINWVNEQRKLHPGADLSGPVENIDYVGSLATGIKGAPKQFARFNVNKFDVDANLVAPPLAKFAMIFDHVKPDRRRIFALGQGTSITPLLDFCFDTHRSLSNVKGYDGKEQFDVVIDAPELPEQEWNRKGTERIYAIREDLRKKLGDQPGEVRYNSMIEELSSAGLLEEADTGERLKGELSKEETAQLNKILRKYE